eukprot:CAMPEP_0168472820 /NCGR_PEP_ID=MMETSP0228-20121227/60000_1 /TAXON_ID=133427 /ORGANISM="Protoceratium reticulatum, Strain CCCM 535 (=CCMP 1889)" /LENGTH=96 /DNA_ID=CAMNT_0008488783 /DNA_START=823 /DNA_END=1111 /DNA_ORIENTATION=+
MWHVNIVGSSSVVFGSIFASPALIILRREAVLRLCFLRNTALEPKAEAARLMAAAANTPLPATLLLRAQRGSEKARERMAHDRGTETSLSMLGRSL